jgi:ribonuclease HI
VKQSSEAELAAIFAGVHLAIEAWKPELRGVFVRSDALDVVHLLHGKSRIRSPAMRRLHARLSELTEQHGVAISARWVKGHRNPKSGTSAFLNAACDRLAGQLRRAKRPRG